MGIPNFSYAEEESKLPVTMRQYTKRDIFPHAVSEALGLINDKYDCIWKKRCMKRSDFPLDTQYDTIHLLEAQEY